MISRVVTFSNPGVMESGRRFKVSLLRRFRVFGFHDD